MEINCTCNKITMVIYKGNFNTVIVSLILKVDFSTHTEEDYLGIESDQPCF